MAIWGRAAENAQRLALIYACSENHLDLQIREPAIRWAWELMEHQARQMIFHMKTRVADNPFEAMCLKLLAKLRTAPDQRLPHSVLLKRMKIDARSFQNLITTLVQRGDVIVTPVATSGRPTTWYGLVRPGRGERSEER